MKIDIEKLDKLVEKSDEIFLSPEGEKVLVDLLKIQQQVEDAIKAAKEKLEAKALSISPDFKSIRGDSVKVYYRSFGQRYYVDEKNIEFAPKEVYTTETKTTYKVDTKALEKWVDENKGMPAGIVEVERKKSITFGLKKGAEHDK